MLGLKRDDFKSLWNHGGSMFATFWIVIALYALGGYLVWAFLQLDAEFSRPLAGGVVPENVTQQIAWGTRAFSVIAGSVAIYFAAHKMHGWKWFFTALTAIAALLLLIHAYGVSAKIVQGQFKANAAIGEVADVNTGAIDDQIADLQAERDDLRADTAATLDRYQRSIDSITNDGLDNDDQAVELAAKQAAAASARDSRVKEIRQEISDLRTEKRGVSSKATVDEANSSGFNDLFLFFARLSTWEWDPAVTPSVVHSFGGAMGFFTLFFGFGEILMMACFTGGYAVLKLRSVQEKDKAEGEYKDPVRVEAGKKAAATVKRKKRVSNKIELRADTLAPSWAHAVKLAKNTTWTAENIAKTAFKAGNMEEVIAALWKAEKARDPEKVETPYITDEQVRLVKRQDKGLPVVAKPNSVDIIHPDPKTTNGSGAPLEQSEPEQSDDDASQRDSV